MDEARNGIVRSTREPSQWHATASLTVGLLGTFLMIGLIPSFFVGVSGHAAAPSIGPANAPVAAGGLAASVTHLSPGAPTIAPPQVRMGHFSLPGPHPRAFGPSGTPPGAEAILPQSSGSGGWGGGGGGGGSSGGSGGSSSPSSWNNRFCAGLWPSFENAWGLNSQAAYASGCYGHDEPAIQFYSNLQGSGGNVTWQVTLPTDRDATHNQSDLYAAIWFGMAMNDPYGWLDQCFLELQFYPDQTFYNPGPSLPNWTVNGAWIGAAVAWQIEAATGYENPCFYTPLYLNGVPGPAFLNMTQGDQISVTMTGWAHSTTGEQISIVDNTNHQRSNVTMYNSAQGYPINPSYRTNSIPAAFEWTPGGEYPVSFAFETGHAGNPSWPANNSYGGCSGGSVSTPSNPGAPCPSYDPGSWANDTLTPWHIDVPTFFNSKAHDTPSQVGFTNPDGGIGLTDETANGACNGLEGSAWCSYPWYSYDCGQKTFFFGATDYTGVTSDFGKYAQFATYLLRLDNGGSFFPPINDSVPVCAGHGATVSVGPSAAGGGSVYFLSNDYASPGTVTGLGNGSYSIHAISAPGMYFSHWKTTGHVGVGISTSPWGNLVVAGSGTVQAVFTATPSNTVVKFKDAGAGRVGVDPTFLWEGNDPGLATVANGGTVSLAPGIYGIQAYPKPGWNFSYWTVNSSGAGIAAMAYPFTYLIVNGLQSSVTVTAWYTPTTTNATVYVYVVGDGSVTIGSLHVANLHNPLGYGFGYGTMAVGSYHVTIKPAADSIDWQILYGPPLLIINNSLDTVLSFENGTGVFEVVFTPAAAVTFAAAPSGGGGIELGAGEPGFAPVPLGHATETPLGIYYIAATPSPGYSFTGWLTSNSANVAFGSSGLFTTVTILGPAKVTASFVATSTHSTLTLKDAPAASGGTITFNLGHTYAGGSVLSGLAPSQYVVAADPPTDWYFSGWTATGHVSISGSSSEETTQITVAAGAGTLVAHYTKILYAVTFVIWVPGASSVPGATATINGVTLHTGETVWLPAGTYTVVLHSPLGFSKWVGTGNDHPGQPSHRNTTLHVSGSGTIYALMT